MDQRSAFESVMDVVKNYAHFLKESGLNIQNVYLFGSYAKGTFREDSDIDLAVVMKNLQNSFTMQVQLMNLRNNFDTRIEPHPFDERDFDDSHPFAYEILKSGIPIL